jgi:hypothetical protein
MFQSSKFGTTWYDEILEWIDTAEKAELRQANLEGCLVSLRSSAGFNPIITGESAKRRFQWNSCWQRTFEASHQGHAVALALSVLECWISRLANSSLSLSSVGTFLGLLPYPVVWCLCHSKNSYRREYLPRLFTPTEVSARKVKNNLYLASVVPQCLHAILPVWSLDLEVVSNFMSSTVRKTG